MQDASKLTEHTSLGMIRVQFDQSPPPPPVTMLSYQYVKSHWGEKSYIRSSISTVGLRQCVSSTYTAINIIDGEVLSTWAYGDVIYTPFWPEVKQNI